MSVGWGLAFIGTGANVFFHLHDFGDDPRCMVGWKMEPKVYFLMPTIGTAALAIVVMAGIIGQWSLMDRLKHVNKDACCSRLAMNFSGFVQSCHASAPDKVLCPRPEHAGQRVFGVRPPFLPGMVVEPDGVPERRGLV